VTQADLCFDALVKLPTQGTQNYRLLMAMQNGERLTVALALSKYTCYALSQRCTELRRMGWPVLSRTIKVGPKSWVSEYYMESQHGRC
jgi:hypothetical protein